MSYTARDIKDAYGGNYPKALREDAYSGNYPKARNLALARSNGKCQFCGLRNAEEGHHWAYLNYPSGEKVQGHDLTALCKGCHELATLLRDWIARQNADYTVLIEELEHCRTFIAKREVFSYWLYPDHEHELKTEVDSARYKARNSARFRRDSTRYRTKEKVNGTKKKRKKMSLKMPPVVAYFFWFVLVPGLVFAVIYYLSLDQ